MASNARFEIEISGNTASFENSLKGVNTAMKSLRGEANTLRKAIKLDPSDMNSTAKLQENLQKQLQLSKDRASKLKAEMKGLGDINPDNQGRFLKLQKQLNDTAIDAQKLENELTEAGQALKNGTWDVKGEIELGNSGEKVDSLKNKFSGLREIAVGALRQIGSTAVSAIGNGLKGWVSDAAATQKSMIALQNTMKFKGNAQDFGMVSKSMQKLAKDTNANTEDTMKLATTFIGLGDNAKKAVGKTEALVKANQAFGGSGENLKGVVQAYGQMSAAGKVSAENINQLTDNNTALGASLKDTIMQMNPTLKQYGSFNEAVSKGAVSMDMLDQAMQKMASGSGGGVTTISDAWDSFNETMSIALLPTLEALTPVITGLIDKMSNWGEIAGNAISSIVQYIQLLWYELEDNGAIDLFVGGFKAIGNIFGSLWSIIKQLLQGFGLIPEKASTMDESIKNTGEFLLQLGGNFEAVMIKVSNFVKKISESKTAIDVIKTAIVGLGVAFAAFKISKGVIAGIKAFQTLIKTIQAVKTAVTVAGGAMKALTAAMSLGVWGIVTAAIVAVVGALVYFFTQTETGKKIWADFVEFLKNAWQSILDFFSGMGQWFSNTWNGIVDGAKGIWQGLVDWFNGIVQGIQDTWNGIGEFFTGLWTGIVQGTQNIWNGIVEFFVGLWTSISETATTVWTTITNFIGTVVQSIMNFFQPLISFYQALWNLIFSIINLVLQLILAGVRGLVQGIQALWNGLVNVVQTVWNFILGIVQTVASTIQSAVNAMGNFINGVWQAIKNFFTPIFQAIGNFASQVFQNIANFASQAWSNIQGVWNVVVGWFSNIFNSVKNTVSSAFNTFGNFARNAWNSITNIFNNVAGWFSSKFDSIKEIVGNVFNAFGNIAQGAWDAITGVFGGIGDWFDNIFGGVKKTIDNALGGVTDVINGISGAINGISGKVSGLFKGSMVEAIGNVKLNGSGVNGIEQNSVTSADNRTYNTFNIQGGTQNVTALAREVTRLQKLGRAGA